MTLFLLDTNHLAAALEAKSTVFKRVVAARRGGARVGTCSPVLCELAVGLEQTRRRETNWEALRLFLRQVRVWPIDLEASRLYGQLYHELRAKGRVLSQVDMMIAALARRMGGVVVSTDRDFEAVENLRTENWLLSSD